MQNIEQNTQVRHAGLLKKVLLRFGMALPVLAALVFLPAGTFAFWEGWLYLAILLIPMLFALVYLYRNDPDLLERRMHMREQEKQQVWIIWLSSLYYLAIFTLPGLDHRFGWTHTPVPLVLLGALLVLLGYGIVLLVFRENRYASRVVEVAQGQQVINTGPYAYVRHPMYSGVTLLCVATPLALGALWVVVPALLIIPILAARLRNEEEVLARDLPGYTAYMQQVRYRLLPGVW
jgi:protein-S-isoprenylcysteine O-methyltransferase Ste14